MQRVLTARLDAAKLKEKLNAISELEKHGGKCNTTC